MPINGRGSGGSLVFLSFIFFLVCTVTGIRGCMDYTDLIAF